MRIILHALCAGLAIVSASAPAGATNRPTVPGRVMAMLENWLDANSEYPRREPLPSVVFVTPAQAAAMQGDASFTGGAVRGLYDDDVTTIYLSEPWSPDDPRPLSVLLHELVHHRQATARHWYCEAEQEWRAYQLQAAWLEEQGVEPNFYWPLIVLESSCTPRDIHPPGPGAARPYRDAVPAREPWRGGAAGPESSPKSRISGLHPPVSRQLEGNPS